MLHWERLACLAFSSLHFDYFQSLEIDFPELWNDPEQTGSASEGNENCWKFGFSVRVLQNSGYWKRSTRPECLLPCSISVLLSWQQTPSRYFSDRAGALTDKTGWIWTDSILFIHQQCYYMATTVLCTSELTDSSSITLFSCLDENSQWLPKDWSSGPQKLWLKPILLSTCSLQLSSVPVCKIST